MKYGIFPRHDSASHYANIPSGYYTLLTYLIFVVLIIVIRKYHPNRSSNIFIKRIYELNPIFLISYFATTIFVILFSTFFTQNERVVSVFTKRLGRVSYAFTNFLILMMFQEPISLFNRLVSYLEFVNLHKWLSRAIFIISILHGFMFICKWSSDPNISLWNKMIVNKANFIGLILYIEVCFMLIVSLRPVRQKSYKLFYLSHQIINLSFIMLTPFHARPSVTFPFFVINLVLLTIYGINKSIQSHQITILDKREVLESRLYILTMSANWLGDTRKIYPGSHIRVSPYSIWSWKYWLLPSHPYTVVTHRNSEITLIIKKTKFEIFKNKTYRISGPFENVSITQFFEWSKKLNNVILVAGGSGISFILPIYHYIQDNQDSTISYKSLKLIWLVKNISEFKHVRDNIGLPSKYFKEMEVFITAETEENNTIDFINENENDIELQNFVPIENKNNTDIEIRNNIKYGRVNWEIDFEDILNSDYNERIGNYDINTENYIIGCGPQELIHDCEIFGRQHNYKVISEYYSL